MSVPMKLRKPLNARSPFWLAALVAVVGICVWAPGARSADVTPQALADAFAKDPGYLHTVPNSSLYHQGRAEPVSLSDARAGVIAEFVVAFDYKTPDPTSGITYRIFRDRDSAQRYYDKLSVFNSPGFVVNGNSTAVDRSTYPSNNPQKDGYKEIKCETFLDPRANYALTARCAALHTEAPVIVAGVRIQNKQGVPQSGGSVSYTMNRDEVNTADANAVGLVLAGTERVTLEYVVLWAKANMH
jgi:predicted GNAT superfamily acetyltransferase